jgi:hypothetical protein
MLGVNRVEELFTVLKGVGAGAVITAIGSYAMRWRQENVATQDACLNQLDRLGRFEHACASFISSNEFEKASVGCELSTKLPTLPETFSTGGFWGWTKSTLAANLRALPEQIEAAQAHVEAALQIDWDAGNAVLRENEKGVKPGVRAVELGAGIRRRYFLEQNKFTGSNGGLMFTPNA